MLYSMKVHPPLWRAGLRQNFRIFQNEDIKSILGTMLQENGGGGVGPLFLGGGFFLWGGGGGEFGGGGKP